MCSHADVCMPSAGVARAFSGGVLTPVGTHHPHFWADVSPGPVLLQLRGREVWRPGVESGGCLAL